MDNREVLLEVKNVSKIYGDLHALKEVNFQVRKGEWVAIMGSSGSGKSTLLNAIGGLEKIDSGSIEINEYEISSLKQNALSNFRRKYLGFIFQFYNLIPTLTAYENVDMVSKLSDVSISADEALEMVGLKDRAENLPSRLSGGELQRVSIARALCKNPKLLLCDEPTAALDSETGKKVLITLSSMAKDYGHTVVLVTHNAAVAPAADRLIRLRDGEVSEVMDQENPISMEEVFW